ncbi:hypothetical protein MEO42_19210, partial [Dolichospermum sp. ST_sed6]|nr:hypothetical protein [Dolichospermum sp. ST_sed6]MDD1466582.1 hypothetical protein [Dolichospermum sp. ST_sed5]
MNNPESYSDNNQISLTTILRAIRFSQNQFSLLFLRCNYGKLQQEIVKELQKTSPVPIRELSVKTSTKSLQSQISEELINEQPQALMIFGLDPVENIESFLKSANQSREEFRKNFPFPVLIWIDDQMLKTIIRIAPDLENWGSVIDFEHDNDDLIDLLQQTTEEIFNHEVIVTPQVYKEITSANQDLQKRGQEIDPEIQAKLQFVLGLTEYWQNNLNLALNYYQSSLKFWQDNNNLESQGIVLVKIALAYVKQVEITNDENLENWQNARNYLQEAITIFENIARSDLVIENSNILGGILRNLKTWTELENLAQKSIQLYIKVYENTFPVSPSLVKNLGQNYGFLAEVALENQEYQKANQNAQKAIKILANIPEIANYEYSVYRLLLARSQIGLNEISSAIKTLETAKNQSHPQYNPTIYIKILKELHSLYFQENQYLKAFKIKQERLQIKQQYGFLAFVGASYLNPQWKVINSISEIQQTGTIAQEISASGREEDVKRLRGRISETENKLIVIHGQSGVGKSSILQGGLVPALQQEPIGEKDALPILLRVYTNWIELLEKSLISNILNVETFHGTSLQSTETSLQSTDKIIEQLRKNANRNILTVLIFDQFEEFFFVYPDREKRQSFYDFLKISLDIPFIKIVLSLREDYLHYLLEIDRLCNLTVTSNNILDKKIRYYLGNFTSADAKSVIESLTTRSKFYLQPELIDELVKDLAGNIGEIRPIELQIVGSQLQTEKITTLEKYQEFGKEKLVEKFLEDVIKDCGAENEKFARLVLYLLTDENGTRPLKTRAELSEQLAEINKNLDLVLNIFIGSGLVLLLPESPENRYQLVHDYLVEFIRKQQGNELLEKLAKAEAELKQEQEARQILANAKIQADTQIAKAEKRLKLSSTLALGLVIIAGLASVYGINQVREANIAKTKQQESEQKNQELQNQTQYLTLQSEQAEKTKQAAEKKFKLAQQNIKKAQKNLLAAKIKVDEVNKQANILKQQNTAATEKIKTANDNVKAAADKLQAAQKQQQETERKAKKAEETFVKANAAKKEALKAQQEALIVTKLEQGGVNVLRQFQLEELPSLVNALQNAKTLKQLVKNRPLDKYPTISPIYALNNILDNISDRNIFKGHQREVNSVSFSPDGKTIATASDDKTARLWNLQGQLIQEFKGHQGYVISV